MIVSEICEYLGSRLKVPTEINGFLVSIIASLYQKPKIENLILWWFYDIMIFCEICEYLGPRLKVPTEINGFLLSIDASLYQKPKIGNLILWWFYDTNWNKRIPTLYRCLFVSETKNRKSNFMMILWYYDIMIVSEIWEYLGSRLKVPTEINGFLVSIIEAICTRHQKSKI